MTRAKARILAQLEIARAAIQKADDLASDWLAEEQEREPVRDAVESYRESIVSATEDAHSDILSTMQEVTEATL